MQLALLVLGLLGGALMPSAAAAGPAPWVGLAGGRLGDYHWSVRVHRPAGPAGEGREGASRPCLMVGASWRFDSYDLRRSRYRVCTGGERSLTPAEPPLIATAEREAASGTSGVTTVGMVFSPGTESVLIRSGDGESRVLHLSRLDRHTAHSAGLVPLRYAAFVVRGGWCAEQLTTRSASGRVLWDGGAGQYQCAASSEAG